MNNEQQVRMWASEAGISIGTKDGGPYPTIQQLAAFAQFARVQALTEAVEACASAEAQSTKTKEQFTSVELCERLVIQGAIHQAQILTRVIKGKM